MKKTRQPPLTPPADHLAHDDGNMGAVTLVNPMEHTVTKSAFKARALELFREIERTGRPIVISDRGRPVLKVTRYVPKSLTPLESLRGSVRHYDHPVDPVGLNDWESLKA